MLASILVIHFAGTQEEDFFLVGESLNVACNSVPIYVVADVPNDLMPSDANKPFPRPGYTVLR